TPYLPASPQLTAGVEIDLHLTALGEDGDSVVLVGGKVDAIGRGRRAQLVDLFLERGDLLARLVERIDELLVLVERLDQLPPRAACPQGPGSRSHRGWRRARRIAISRLLPPGSAMLPCAPRTIRLAIAYSSRDHSVP